MVTTTFTGELLQPYARHAGLLQPLAVPVPVQTPQHPHQHARRLGLETPMTAASVGAAAAAQKRSPLLCGYPSKKCWSWRVEKRNGELHKFCEYHRQKANTNQRRMEQRRKLGRSAGPRGTKGGSNPTSPRRGSAKVSSRAQPETVVKVEQVKVESTSRPGSSSSLAKKVATPKAKTAPSGSPRGIDCFETGNLSGQYAMDATAGYSWNDVEVDIGISVDAAVEYMMVDSAAIDMEPSDKPVDLYEEDLFFLEHFIAEISHSAV